MLKNHYVSFLRNCSVFVTRTKMAATEVQITVNVTTVTAAAMPKKGQCRVSVPATAQDRFYRDSVCGCSER